MAVCGSLQHIFKKPPPENPTLLESLSWNQIKPTKPNEQDSSSFTEIFGELHFKENPEPYPPSLSPPTLPPSTTKNDQITPTPTTNKNPSPDYLSTIFSSMNSESLQLCTEGLGFESSADVEELRSDTKINGWEEKGEVVGIGKESFLHGESGGKGELMRRVRKSGGEFPPPISSIGESGKPWVWFKSYRQNGRFVLKEIRVPNQEFLHASREDGRLKLQFFQADGEDGEDDDDDDDYNDDYDDERDGIVGEEEEEMEEMMGR
ncbi:protein FAF-like, chloroplastic [Rhododendron vialii]|uniref:protein FAF-like, chloroplastic n=1 Tax=Rhododendron vialii TaxID=182163 RepID=UPI00265E7814|nr:protein FAF-like, chloroplastic [Rhododendron vialii]